MKHENHKIQGFFKILFLLMEPDPEVFPPVLASVLLASPAVYPPVVNFPGVFLLWLESLLMRSQNNGSAYHNVTPRRILYLEHRLPYTQVCCGDLQLPAFSDPRAFVRYLESNFVATYVTLILHFIVYVHIFSL
jgi:hypothetical protein